VGKIINGHKLTEEFINNVTSLTNLSYIKNMNVPKEISDVRENQASILYKEFNKFLKNPATDLANEGKPKLPRIAFETKECYFLRPKETNNLSSPEYEQIIETFEVPLGTTCATCTETLHFPYYFGIGSKKHRCIKCTEQYDEKSQDKLKRYAVN
jgi:hypothetical protein